MRNGGWGKAVAQGRPGEFDLIARIAARLRAAGVTPAGPPGPGAARSTPEAGVVVGIGDDAAVLRPDPGRDLVATCDMLVDGVHFRSAWSAPEAIGHRALAVSLSDLAAMGADARWALWSAGLPARVEADWVERMVDGFAALAARHGVQAVGGNLARAPRLVLDVTALGAVPRNGHWLRSTARPGDRLLLTGAAGAAAAGLAALAAGLGRAPELAGLVAAYERPEPRLREAAAARAAGGVSAAIDVSDGLGGAARHLAGASGVGVVLEVAALPVPEAARDLAARLGEDDLAWALGGDDYELLWAVRPDRAAALARAVREATGTPVTDVGEVVPEPGLWLRADGRLQPLQRAGYDHYRRG